MAPTETEQINRVDAQLESISAIIAADNLRVYMLVRRVISNVEQIKTDMENLPLPDEASQ